MAFDASKSVILEFRAVAAKGTVPALDDVKKTFGLSDDEVNPVFSVMDIYNSNNGKHFLVNVTQVAAERIEKSGHADFVRQLPNKQMAPLGG